MNKLELQKKLNQSKKLLEECLDYLNSDKELTREKELVSKPKAKSLIRSELDYSQNYRVFFKNNVDAKMNGQKKFALVAVYLTKGNLKQKVSKSDIEQLWKKVKKFMCASFANSYGTRAKDNEYLNSPKNSIYVLGKKWKEIFN